MTSTSGSNSMTFTTSFSSSQPHTLPGGHATTGINNNTDARHFVQFVSMDEDVSTDAVAMSRTAPAAMAAYTTPSSSSTITHHYSQEHLAYDAMALADRAAMVKQALASRGCHPSDDAIVQAAMERANAQDDQMAQERRDYRHYAITEHHRAQDNARSERHHQDRMHAAQEDKEWLEKLNDIYDQTTATFATTFLLALMTCILAELFDQLCQIGKDGGLSVAATALHDHLLGQCTPDPIMGFVHRLMPNIGILLGVADETAADTDDSWSGYARSALVGPFNYASTKATAYAMSWQPLADLSSYAVNVAGVVSTGPCYLVQIMLLTFAVYATCKFFCLTKDLPHVVRLVLFGMYAILISGLTWMFVTVVALGSVGLVLWARHRYNKFVKAFQESMPLAQDVTEARIKFAELAKLGMLMPMMVMACRAVEIYLENQGWLVAS